MVTYSLGDWCEDFVGESVLYGDALKPTKPGLLVRRTSWMAEPAARPDGVATSSDDDDHASLSGSACGTAYGTAYDTACDSVCALAGAPAVAPAGAPAGAPARSLLPAPATAALLPAECVAHTTWTSRTDDTAEIVARFLRDGELIVRRTLLATPLRAYAGIGQPARVCEEVFVRAGENVAEHGGERRVRARLSRESA